ncbi:MAG: rhomboid family intramembrane serine protease [Bacilli bacterium]|nr:rhomboid family intramembrane serine protease [Bacilli bacterium]
MSTIVIDKKDEMIMALVHYFVTVKNYTPIVVKGVKDEIWLENNNAAYKIIRINSNYIHNNEQLDFDFFKTKSIVKQIKKKTFSFSLNTLNIFTDLGDNVELRNDKNIDTTTIKNLEDIKQNKELLEVFPDINQKLITDKTGIDFIVNVTSDLNQKTEKANKIYEDTFKPKKIFVTKILIISCILMYLISGILSGNLLSIDTLTLYKLGANEKISILAGQVYRLFTYMFLHGNITHIFVNMYSLAVIGNQIETFLGKAKFLAIYLFSGITAGLLSAILTGGISIGASGAIFGLLGALLYFGYHYRIYLGEALKRQIIPIILLNLVIGFIIPGIDNAAHIGGLVGGFLMSMAVGVTGKTNKQERINGLICCAILIVFLGYLLFR